jgi:hypothetical protein
MCSHCGVVITSVGGTLGLTSAYGVGDPTITRRRVEADLAVFREYQMKYRGMLEACKQQLNWGVERYAKLPNPPELLPLVPVPPIGPIVWSSVGYSIGWVFVLFCVYIIVELARELGIHSIPKNWADPPLILGWLLIWVLTFVPYIKANAANGERPLENARRQKAYEEACAAALRAAEPIKAAEDHRLRCQIRELEGLAKTVGEKEADVRRILATL